ncbi:4'-phosphopantetheinyl transferase superfamily protein [Pseudactinotalea sp. HY158]|uniref:4'-phosphopantetheinyl transferase family protein n=1 Tax=Pseudactinotalea sp. HY158 TaxID=2654547 RepID=UPI00129CEC07|nr:4'-phosphopantetheinyl transferase superfamily protein [Pseudactinotalea sp. HY158]QGH69469.1 4'-phosphopantetheinyl transferase superfamily protein [Pseudactinotalea sp. HY158]
MDGVAVKAWHDSARLYRAAPNLRISGLVHLALVRADAAAWASLLSGSESIRAAAIRSKEQRAEFVTGRAVAKTLAGAVSGSHPSQVQIQQECVVCGSTTHGRPIIRGVEAVQVSVAHREGNVLVGMTVDGPIGVDVEVDRRVTELRGMAALALTAEERARLDRLDELAASRWFLTRWCLKEAVTKRSGVGLTQDFASLEVDGERDRVVVLTGDNAPPGLVIAVAVAQQTAGIRWVFP